MLASTPEALYVCLMGTKHMRDVLVDINFLHRPLWHAEQAAKGVQVGRTNNGRFSTTSAETSKDFKYCYCTDLACCAPRFHGSSEGDPHRTALGPLSVAKQTPGVLR